MLSPPPLKETAWTEIESQHTEQFEDNPVYHGSDKLTSRNKTSAQAGVCSHDPAQQTEHHTWRQHDLTTRFQFANSHFAVMAFSAWKINDGSFEKIVVSGWINWKCRRKTKPLEQLHSYWPPFSQGLNEKISENIPVLAAMVTHFACACKSIVGWLWPFGSRMPKRTRVSPLRSCQRLGAHILHKLKMANVYLFKLCINKTQTHMVTP